MGDKYLHITWSNIFPCPQFWISFKNVISSISRNWKYKNDNYVSTGYVWKLQMTSQDTFSKNLHTSFNLHSEISNSTLKIKWWHHIWHILSKSKWLRFVYIQVFSHLCFAIGYQLSCDTLISKISRSSVRHFSKKRCVLHL